LELIQDMFHGVGRARALGSYALSACLALKLAEDIGRRLLWGRPNISVPHR
jgi:hypothetical protein